MITPVITESTEVVLASETPGGDPARWYRNPHNAFQWRDASGSIRFLDELIDPTPFVGDDIGVIRARHGRNGRIRTWYRSPQHGDQWLSFTGTRVILAPERELLDVSAAA
jgi:hypothetical protein